MKLVRRCILTGSDIKCLIGHEAKARNNRKKEKEGGNDRTQKNFFKSSLSKKYHEAKVKGE